jgi:hypothetical protein
VTAHLASLAEAHRAARAAHAAARGGERSHTGAALMKIVSRAATLLPARGEDAEWPLAALGGEHGDETRSFAMAVLGRRRQFPRVYLEAFVRTAIALGSAGDRALEVASSAHGAIPVLDAMTKAAEDGALSYSLRRLLTYYVRPRPGEDRAALHAAHLRLKHATWKAPDAPPGARMG